MLGMGAEFDPNFLQTASQTRPQLKVMVIIVKLEQVAGFWAKVAADLSSGPLCSNGSKYYGMFERHPVHIQTFSFGSRKRNNKYRSYIV